MIKIIVNALLVAALVAGGTQAMENARMSDEQFNQWLAQQALVQADEDKLAKAMHESAVLYEQQQATTQKEAAQKEAAQKEVTRRQQEISKNTIQDLVIYVRGCTDKFNAVGIFITTKENENLVEKLGDSVKLELTKYSLEDLRLIRNAKKFDGLNSIVKGKVENALLDKFEEQKEGKIIEDILPGMNHINGAESSIYTHEHKSPEFKIMKTGDNLLCTMGEEAFFRYDYGIKIFERENSSGNNNCCLLFSIIDNAELYAKVMGVSINDAQKWLDANPELANVSPQDCGDLNRRDFKPVRRKFFDDILANLDKNVVAQDGHPTTLRAFMENGFRTCPHEDVKTIFSINEQVSDALDYLHNGDISLEKFFATAFGWIYDVKVVVLNGDIENKDNPYRCILENANMGHPELMPMITPQDVANLIYVYIGGDRGGHYQKLHVLG